MEKLQDVRIIPMRTLRKFVFSHSWSSQSRNLDIDWYGVKPQYLLIQYSTYVEINRNAHSVIVRSTVGEMRFEKRLSIPEGVGELLEDIEGAIEMCETVDSSEMQFTEEDNHCCVELQYYKGESINIKAKYIKQAMPKWWDDVVETINNFLSFYSQQESIVPPKKEFEEGMLIYCSCSFEESSKTYYYRTSDKSIEEGDYVVVPVGSNNNEKTVYVEKVEYFKPDEVPLPIEKTKEILRRAEDDEDSSYYDDDDEEQVDVIVKIFTEPEVGWGSRGNALLWQDLCHHFLETGLPSTFYQLEKDIYTFIEQLIGKEFTEPTFVEKYDTGGMSSGIITPDWWKETGVPELKKRFGHYLMKL